MQKRGKGKNIGYSCMNPTLRTRILHPILHPKLSVNKRPLVFWCRKCRRFSKTFFVEGRARRPTGRCKTSDFFGQKYGCFAPKVRMFSSKKSDVFIFRKGNSIIWMLSSNLSGGIFIMSNYTSKTWSSYLLGRHGCPQGLSASRIQSNGCSPCSPAMMFPSNSKDSTCGSAVASVAVNLMTVCIRMTHDSIRCFRLFDVYHCLWLSIVFTIAMVLKGCMPSGI